MIYIKNKEKIEAIRKSCPYSTDENIKEIALIEDTRSSICRFTSIDNKEQEILCSAWLEVKEKTILNIVWIILKTPAAEIQIEL